MFKKKERESSYQQKEDNIVQTKDQIKLASFIAGGAFVALISNRKKSLLDILPLISTIIYISSRLPQVLKNLSSKSTGELSASTWFLNGLGGLVRIYTTLKEVKDPFVLISFTLSTLLNFTILGQIIYYKRITP